MGMRLDTSALLTYLRRSTGRKGRVPARYGHQQRRLTTLQTACRGVEYYSVGRPQQRSLRCGLSHYQCGPTTCEFRSLRNRCTPYRPVDPSQILAISHLRDPLADLLHARCEMRTPTRVWGPIAAPARERWLALAAHPFWIECSAYGRGDRGCHTPCSKTSGRRDRWFGFDETQPETSPLHRCDRSAWG